MFETFIKCHTGKKADSLKVCGLRQAHAVNYQMF